MRFLGYAMVIGAMKAGTTTLHHLLAQHPAILPGVEKELNYFHNEAVPSVADYESLFPSLNKRRVAYTLDSSPNYAKPGRFSRAPIQIASLPGHKRLIYVLRNPIERIDSHIAHSVAEGRFGADDWRLDWAIKVSAYAGRLKLYEKAGLLGDIHLVDFDDLSADPVATALHIHDFLGIDRVRPRRLPVLNKRRMDATFLRDAHIREIRRALRRDVRILINRYGFEAAEAWGIA